jgi:hypothetical protein
MADCPETQDSQAGNMNTRVLPAAVEALVDTRRDVFGSTLGRHTNYAESNSDPL